MVGSPRFVSWGRQILGGHAWDCLCPSPSVSTLPCIAGCTHVGSSLCLWQLDALPRGSEAQASFRTIPKGVPG